MADTRRSSMGRQAIVCYLQRAGVVRSIKRSTHRRVRREAKAEIRREMA